MLNTVLYPTILLLIQANVNQLYLITINWKIYGILQESCLAFKGSRTSINITRIWSIHFSIFRMASYFITSITLMYLIFQYGSVAIKQ